MMAKYYAQRGAAKERVDQCDHVKAVRAFYDFWNAGNEVLLKDAVAPLLPITPIHSRIFTGTSGSYA
jgi:hypothetical protein